MPLRSDRLTALAGCAPGELAEVSGYIPLDAHPRALVDFCEQDDAGVCAWQGEAALC